MANSELTQFLKENENKNVASAAAAPCSATAKSSTTPPPNGDFTRSRARWKLLSKAVKSKQFQRSDLDSGYLSDQLSSTTSSNSSSGSGSASSSVPQTPELLSELAESPHLPASPQPGHPGSLIQAYNLMTYHHLDDTWISCSWNAALEVHQQQPEDGPFRLQFKFVPPHLNLRELGGFDNSGNVRLWPCEELLAYLVYGQLRERLRGTRIIELGAGMTALAGLVAIGLDLAPEIHLTDGNDRCVANIRQVVARNFSWTSESVPVVPGTVPVKVAVSRLRWEVPGDYVHLVGRIESIICADCLFVRKHHRDLLETLDRLLVPVSHASTLEVIGTCYILAPARGRTMTEFIDLVESDNRFTLWQFEHFDGPFTKWYADGGTYTNEMPYLLVIRRKGSPPFEL